MKEQGVVPEVGGALVAAAALGGWVAGWFLDCLDWPVGGGRPRWVPGAPPPWCRGARLASLSTAAAWAAVAWRAPTATAAVPGWLLASVVVAAAVSDLASRRVPNGLVAAGAVAWLPVAAVAGSGWGTAVGGAILLGGALMAAGVFQRGAMGAGDVKLAAMVGLYLGWPRAAAAFVLIALTGAAAGSALLLANVRTRKDAIPFAPFIALGALGSLLFGDELVRWYLGMLLHGG